MKNLFVPLCFIFLNILNATSQKLIHREWARADIGKVRIEDDGLYRITIKSGNFKAIEAFLHVSGEYESSIVLEARLNKGELLITSDYSPFIERPNDKLAAHKVMALEMEINIPAELEVEVQSALASVFVSGSFPRLFISLENGNLTATSFRGNALAQTIWGNINMKCLPQVAGSGTTQFGHIKNELPKNGIFSVLAESIHGNISLLQTK